MYTINEYEPYNTSIIYTTHTKPHQITELGTHHKLKKNAPVVAGMALVGVYPADGLHQVFLMWGFDAWA
ncbi:hypothetical protein ACVGW8_00100, partial [Enterobacter hormaechei]